MAEEIKKGFGYDFKTKHTAPTAYKCLICQLLIRGFTELDCGHSYCRKCLERWEELKIQENKKLEREDPLRCMLCNKDYEVEGKHHSKTFDKIITTELEVLCKHSESGCKWYGVIVDFKNHSDKECEFSEVQCVHTGCDERFQRRAQKHHEENCSFKKIACQYCDEMVKVLTAEKHHGECEMFLIKCPNEKCEETLPRNQMDKHQKLNCLYEEISCPFNKAGCNFKTLRCEMEDHTTKFNNVHTQLLLQMQIDSNIQEMKERLHSTQIELHETKTTLHKTQNELQSTKTTLVATQNELQTTKTTLFTTQNELQAIQLNLEHTMEKFDHSRNDATEKENQIKLLQKNQEKLVDIVIKTNYQTLVIFAAYHFQIEEIDLFLRTLKILPLKKPTNQIEPIEPIEINGRKLEFSKVNELVQNLNNRYCSSYEEKLEMLLKKMKKGQIYHIDGKQVIFKLRLLKNHQKFYISHRNDIASIEIRVVVKNQQLVMVDNYDNYEIVLRIRNYDNGNSNCYLYRNNENGEKLLLKYGDLDYNINIDDYKTASNEVLFHIFKN